ATKQAQKGKHLDIEFGTQTGAEGQHPQYKTRNKKEIAVFRTHGDS
ncbi:36082_t:CDS:2, partial [Gigaspora margarita]